MSFLYLLKDDMFDSKDRKKFFDFIIPVLPVINASNPYEKLKEILESSGKFDNGRLQELTEHCKLLKNLSW
ncbi:hypothetical protein [Leuconostoc mesenteroides]|uniref:YobI family P-loop NTPase n=1 Tax=Leuconostoc mesenteroides TaxID=1245 RepID=UPI0030811FA6